jgi:hypothetical protein
MDSDQRRGKGRVRKKEFERLALPAVEAIKETNHRSDEHIVTLGLPLFQDVNTLSLQL